MLKRTRSQAAVNVDERTSCGVELQFVVVDLPGSSMSQSPPIAELDLENAPFSADQRKWLEQLTQWARPPPPTTSGEQSGGAPSASTAAGRAGPSEGKSASVHTHYS